MTEMEDLIVQATANIDKMARDIAQLLMPAMEKLNAALRAWWRTYPGMPYTAPSQWDAEQMKADR